MHWVGIYWTAFNCLDDYQVDKLAAHFKPVLPMSVRCHTTLARAISNQPCQHYPWPCVSSSEWIVPYARHLPASIDAARATDTLSTSSTSKARPIIQCTKPTAMSYFYDRGISCTGCPPSLFAVLVFLLICLDSLRVTRQIMDHIHNACHLPPIFGGRMWEHFPPGLHV